jgi:CheY-like chemotaxis protein
VIGMIQLLLETDLTTEQRGYASIAQTSGRTLLTLIDDILDLSKIEARKIVLENLDFSLRRLVKDVVQPLRVQASAKNVRIDSFVSLDVPPLVRGDAHRLRQVLTNLSSNAIKFTERGEVTLECSVERVDQGTTIFGFAVADTGIGIRPDQAAALFSPFTQADSSTTRKYGGTGLGLAICKQLVELMGGVIGVNSRAGHGSTFWFTVPFEVPLIGHVEKCVDERGERRVGHRRGKTRATRNARILVAEDNAINRCVALAQLQKLGYTANAVANGLEAVEALEHDSYDLVLMDCEMPVMNGHEATDLIRKSSHAGVPIIALTASAMPEDRDQCLREGMNDYLAKPVDFERLGDALARWLPVNGGADAVPALIPAALSSALRASRAEVAFDEEALLERVMGDRCLAGTVLTRFIEDVPSQLTGLSLRLEEADAPGVGFHSHTIKGAAATVSAESLRALSQAMELAGNAGQLDRCRELLPRAVEEFERFKTVLERSGWV